MKEAIFTISSLAIFLVGVYLVFGLAAVFLVAGAVGVVTGLMWETE